MRYLFLLTLFLFFFSAIAQSESYERKRPKQPDFFMPEGSLKYQPDFVQPTMRRPPSGGAAIISREEPPPAPAISQEIPQSITARNKQNSAAPYNAAQKPPASPYMNLDFSHMTKTPEYQKKYSDYMTDLEVIAKTGVAPFNRQVQNDLTQMNSDERKSVR